MKIAVTNQKGGVGKTTTCINVAYGLASAGKSTLLIDIDPQANSSTIFCRKLRKDISVSKLFLNRDSQIKDFIIPAFVGRNKIENLSLVPSFIDLALIVEQIASVPHREKILLKNLKKIEDQYEYIIIDCPPNLGILTMNAILCADLLLIPTTYSKYSLDGIIDLLSIAQDVKEEKFDDFFILRNCYDAKNKRTNFFVGNHLESIKTHLFETIIRRSETINQSQISDMPVQVFNSKSAGHVDFEAFTKELINICDRFSKREIKR